MREKYTKRFPHPSLYAKTMNDTEPPMDSRISDTYRREKPRLMARLRKAGRTLEEAEDILHDIYADTVEYLSLTAGIVNLPAWLNSVLTRRLVDAWRHDKVRAASGETDVAEETLREIIGGAGLDPLDGFIRENLVDALNDAMRALPPPQRMVMEAQVFGGRTFREIAEVTGESVDTLTARKRYALRSLSKALRQWIED